MAKVKSVRPPRILGVVSDLDGTLLRSDGSISSSTMDLLLSIRAFGAPLVVATARTPRAVRKVAGHQALGRVVCANGAVVWDAARDEVVREVRFDSAALTAAITELRAVLPEAALALLSTQTMFAAAGYIALRRNGAAGAELFTDVTEVLSQHHIVMVAVRHPSFTADQLIGAASDCLRQLRLSLVCRSSDSRHRPEGHNQGCRCSGRDDRCRLSSGSNRRVRRHAQRLAAVRLGRVGMRGCQQPSQRSRSGRRGGSE